MKRKNFLRKAIATATAVAAAVAPLAFTTQTVVAASITNFSDLMTRQQISADSDHTITFTSPTGAAEGTDMTVTFEAGFDLTALTIGDIDVQDDAVSLTTAADCTGTEEAGLSITGQVVTIEICSGDGGAIAAASEVTIAIGDTNQITNPASVDEYEIAIGGTFGDTGIIEVPIIDDDTVNITGYIDTVLSFDIDTTALQQNIGSQLDVNTIAWQSGNTIRYTFNGTPDLSGVSVGEELQIQNATNVVNNGMFTITTVNDGSDFIEVTNLLRADAVADEASDSPAQVYTLEKDCDAVGGLNVCDSHSTANDSAGYVVSLGELSTLQINASGNTVLHADAATGRINHIGFDLTTNANGGAVVTALSLYGELRGPGSHAIASSTNATVSAGEGNYGINGVFTSVNGTGGGTINLGADYAGTEGSSIGAVSSVAPTTIFDTDSAPVDSARVHFEVLATPDASHGTGTYTDEITFIATSTF